MSNSYLPEDLLILVVLRLPAKSLGRLKSVSKSWNALISSKEFMKLHQKQIIMDKNPNIIIVGQVPNDHHPRKEACFQQVHLLEYWTTGGENIELSSKFQLLDHPFDYLDLGPWLEARMVGSCNGLLCQFLCLPPRRYRKLEYDIFLCNPLTKSFWDLPQRSVVYNDDGTSTDRLLSFYGFGYDDFHDDYKVMVASRPSESPSPEYGYDYKYEVYSLRSDAWSIVRSYLDIRDHYVEDGLDHGKCHGAFVNCALHWILRNGFPYYRDDYANLSILAFDLRTNKNKILQVPDKIHPCTLRVMNGYTLSVMNGCLVLNVPSQTSSFDLDLWVMNDYGMKDSWTRMTIHNSPVLLSLSPMALLEDDNNHMMGKLIYYNYYRGTILSYDLASHQSVEFAASRPFRTTKQIFPFTSSLIQPHPSSLGYKKRYRLEMRTYAEPQGNPVKRPSRCFD